jgi:protein-tyrosine phosphatase
MRPELDQAMRQRVYPITKRISIGQFATPDRAYYLLENGCTHVLNVSNTASVIRASENGFQLVVDHPIADLDPIPHETALHCLDTLHEMLGAEASRVYIHCIACQNRSPTILWLYFVGCGMDEDAAKAFITERCPDAVPGHKTMVDDRIARLVREHGQQHFLPLPDPGILESAY